jgi:thiamine pyrophosphokinase
MNQGSSQSRAIVFVNGTIDDYQSFRPFIKPSDTIICVDGGLVHAIKMSLPVHVLLGDMDSVDSQHIKMLDNQTEILRYAREKDETDMELALNWAAREKFSSVVIAGIYGGRLDHTLANIHLLGRRHWPFRASFWETNQYTWILKDGDSLQLEDRQGCILSLIPLSENVTGITVFGCLYRLQNENLEFGSTRGISNEITEMLGEISVKNGVLAVVLSTTQE